MEEIGLLLLLAGTLGLVLSFRRRLGRRKPRHDLPPSFDFGYYKRFEHNR